MTIDNLELPEGWTAEAIQWSTTHILIHAPNQAGMVTVDLKQRVFRLGYATTGRVDTRIIHEGRGWKKALIAEAVAALQAAMQ